VLVLIVILVAAASCVVAYAALSTMNERATVRESLRRLEGYQLQDVRSEEMLRPFDERVLSPVGKGLASFAKNRSPAGYVDGVRRKLEQAGNPRNVDPDQIMALKVVGGVMAGVWFILLFIVLGWKFGLLTILIWLALSVVSFFGPDLWLSRVVKARKHEIATTLPDVLDLLTLSVEAGLGFEQALDRTCAAIPGALSQEFTRMLQEIRLGSSRADSLRAMELRTDVPELRSFVLAMLQADTFGISIARLLRSQAEEMRIRRRQRAQEMAQKAPVKMLFPLVFCIFPSIFVIVLGPAVITISNVL
jgi:tight adherence protein C